MLQMLVSNLYDEYLKWFVLDYLFAFKNYQSVSEKTGIVATPHT